MSLFSREGVKWVATGEDVLNLTTNAGFARDGEDVMQPAGDFYRPYNAVLNRNPEVAMFFRDISDL